MPRVSESIDSVALNSTMVEQPNAPRSRIDTPASIAPHVAKFCRSVNPNAEPVYIAHEADANIIVNECFPDVAAKIDRDGGAAVIGWQVWEFPNVFIEAEFHCVWASPAGHCVDVTPKPEPLARILFLPDTRRAWSGRRVDNIRQSLRDDRVIVDFLRVKHAIFEVANRGHRADKRVVEIRLAQYVT